MTIKKLEFMALGGIVGMSVLLGYFYNGSVGSQGSDGYWWSSTRTNRNTMYRLDTSTSSIYPADNDFRVYDLSVRCVLGS